MSEKITNTSMCLFIGLLLPMYMFSNLAAQELTEPGEGEELTLMPSVFNMDDDLPWGVQPTLFPFEGAELERIENPDTSGLNKTDYVLRYEKTDGSMPWAGFYYLLEEAYQITDSSEFRLKIRSPRSDIQALLKLEVQATGTQTHDLPADITEADEWIELVWDLSDQDDQAPWDRVVIIMDLDNPPGGGADYTWYLDDFRLKDGEASDGNGNGFETGEFTVYFSNPENWAQVYLYAWEMDEEDSFVKEMSFWPGEPADREYFEDGSRWWGYTLPDNYNRVIFNDGAMNQTEDLERNTTGWFDGSQWHDERPDDPDDPDDPVDPDSLISIAEARDLPNGSEVTIEGIITRAHGDFSRIQDETAAMVIRQTDGEWNIMVADGRLAEGDRVRLTGITSEFASLKQINEADLLGFEIISRHNRLPEPQTLNLAEISLNGYALQSQLIRVEELTLHTDDPYFRVNTTYTISDQTLDPGIVGLRISHEHDHPIAGTLIAEGAYHFEGVLGQFSHDDPHQGFQLLPIYPEDMIPADADTPEPEGEREVTFRVDMSYQVENGIFDPGRGDSVQLRGSFTGWDVNPVTMSHESDQVYVTTTSVPGAEGAVAEYKFATIAGDGRHLPNWGWEILDVYDQMYNRTVELGDVDIPMELPTVFFHDLEDTHMPVTVERLNYYDYLRSLDQIPNHWFAGLPTRFDAVIVSHPKNSGLAGYHPDTGDIMRLHVFVVDTEARHLGRDGMYMQLVAYDEVLEELEQYTRGDVIRVEGALTFFNYVAQYEPSSVMHIGTVGEGEYADDHDLLEPDLVSISELNSFTEEGHYSVNLESYSNLVNRYLQVENATVYYSEPADFGRPHLIINQDQDLTDMRDYSLRYRNDYDEYRSGYNRRRGEDGPFVPPTEGSRVNMSGFITVNTFSPTGHFDRPVFSIAPWDDGVLWTEVEGKLVRTEPDGWPVDLQVVAVPDTITRPVTFRVDMSDLVSEDMFRPADDDYVELRGSMTGWDEHAVVMDHEPETGEWIYGTTLDVSGLEGSMVEYKFAMVAGDGRELPGGGWEGAAGPGEFGNRVLELGPADQHQELEIAVFVVDYFEAEEHFSLVVMDVNGVEITLTMGLDPEATGEYRDGIDQYAAPLWPGVFDARILYEDDSYVTLILPPTADQTVWNISLQPPPEGMPIELMWDPGRLFAEGTTSLRDQHGNHILNMADSGWWVIEDQEDLQLQLVHTLATYKEVSWNSHWNMLGLPLHPSDAHYKELFPGSFTNTLYTFDGAYGLREHMEPGTGYWLRFPEGGSAMLSGMAVEHLELDLQAGWNMISGPSHTVEAGMIDDREGIVLTGTLYGFNGAYVQASQLEPGLGYWIRTSGPGTIVLGDAQFTPGKQAAAGEQPDLSGFDRLIVSNGEGHSRTLYFGASLGESIPEMLFTLPPLPPEGAFDARFSDDRRLVSGHSGLIGITSASEISLTLELSDPSADRSYQFTLLDENAGREVLELWHGQSRMIDLPGKTLELLMSRPTGIADEDLPQVYELRANYPNPFNPATTINYSLPEQSMVHLAVYNLLGQKVALLINEERPAGYHQVIFDGTGMSSGVYIYRMQAGDFSTTKQMMLVK